VLRYTVRFASSGMRPAGGLTGMADEGRGRESPPRVPNAGPVTEDEVTEWIGTTGKSPEAAPPGAAAEAGAEAASDAEPESVSWLGAGLAALIVIPALVIGSLAVVAVRHFTAAPKSGPASTAPARHEAAVRGEAAAWVAQQVSRGVAVSCDQVMCAALEARGFPARDLLMLGPVSRDPRSSAVVVETGAVRTLFGTSLDRAWAPAVLASFGSGSAGITVRVVASHGAVAYQTALAGDMAAAKAAGARLLADRRISVQTSARSQLTEGLVDLRLLSALTTLSRHMQVSVVGFGNVGPGVSAGVPLRYVDLSPTSPTSPASQAAGQTQAGQTQAGQTQAGQTQADYARSVRSALSGLDISIRPVRTVSVVLPDGQAVLRAEFTAPSPLGMSGS